MKKKKVIASKNMRTTYPVVSTLTIGISLDYWNAPQWLWGAVGLLAIVAWGQAIYDIGVQEEVDIFDKDKDAN